MSLSLQRNVLASMSASPAQSASSLLSQSFFQKKMKDSVHAVIEKLEKQSEGEKTTSGSPRSCLALSASDVISCGNSIAAESEFSYSQAENDDNNKHSSDQESADEDDAIVSILLAMQKESEKNIEWRGKEENDEYNASDESGDDDETFSKWGNRNDEIGDILASQRLVEEHIAKQSVGSPKRNEWWDIADGEPRPIASPLSELGSPRSSTNAARAIRFGCSPEDLPLVGDIEDLLPPRPQEQIPFTPQEESDPVDRLQLSLTPHPHPLPQASPRIQAPAVGNNRLWLFSPEPPTLSQLLLSSHNIGVDPMQYKPASYSNSADIPDKAMVFGGKKFDFTAQNASKVPIFDTASTRDLLTSFASANSNDASINAPWFKLSELKTSNSNQARGEKVLRKKKCWPCILRV
ncbi:unnamed protein product [Phytophthora lilii]|uniref:Unnamed protein product n=1 Tax=Phytophthora lilii TaxID=2077276 RepID=A0A9W6WLP7_9STRA|nr:unnamed protein product [Phytophthora lilii]